MIAVRDDWRRLIGRTVARGGGAAAGAIPGSPAWRAKEALLEHLFCMPDAQRSWVGRAVRAGMKGDAPDLVYATGGPWSALLAGRRLARRFGVPFVADFRDPWTRNPFRTYAPLALERSRRLERTVCRAAAIVIANTTELCDQFVADYPDMSGRFVTIPNGFDGPRGEDVGPGVHEPAAGSSDAFELWHFGSVYGKRNPFALLTAVCRLADRGRLHPGVFRIRFVGAWELDESDPSSRLARRLEQLGVVVREDAVPHEACLALMQRASSLLVLQPDSPLQVPGKIYEYLAARRPLVLIGGEGATSGLVRRHRLGRTCPNDADAIERLVEELAAGLGPVPPPATALERFDYGYLTARLAALFDSTIGAAPSPRPAFVPIQS
jgi:glycosyltransferase involved in cell wall biosynthesis